MADRSDRRRTPLDRSMSVGTAIAMADEAGVEGLTMRRLAERLGFKVMALYNHVADKDELLALMVDAVAAEIDEPPDAAAWLDAVRSLALATREALVRHPWASEIWQKTLPGPERIGYMETLLRLVHRGGLRPDLAHHTFHAVNNHVLGYTLQELALAFDLNSLDAQARAQAFVASLSPDDHPYTIAHVHQHLDGDTASSFELVLDLILDGVQRLNATA